MEVLTDCNLEEVLASHKRGALFLFAPICGTCQLAEKMTVIVKELFPSVQFNKADLNYHPEFANKHKIKSVPCLLFYSEGKIEKQIYAFHSVNFLYDELSDFIKATS